MARLFTFHSRGLAATFADIENHAVAQARAPLATPGSVLERTNAGGFRYYALQRYGPDGKRSEAYLAGPVGDDKADVAAKAARDAIAEARDTIESVRLLVREGYAAVDPKPYSVIATISNCGIFSGGGFLVGTHAFEVIANRLGIRASGFPTEDIDIARPTKLAIEGVPEGGFLEVIRQSGVDFVAVPNFDPRDPPLKYKEKGRSRFTVDLLVPTDGKEASTQLVPELKAHATALPYFRYLVAESQPGAVISRIGCALVRVPLPERMALHKMVVAQLRAGRPQKSDKDLRQAATLAAALSERQPGSLEDAFKKTPTSVRSHLRKSAGEMRELLVDHPAALEEFAGIGLYQAGRGHV